MLQQPDGRLLRLAWITAMASKMLVGPHQLDRAAKKGQKLNEEVAMLLSDNREPFQSQTLCPRGEDLAPPSHQYAGEGKESITDMMAALQSQMTAAASASLSSSFDLREPLQRTISQNSRLVKTTATSLIMSKNAGIVIAIFISD